jgi:ACS family hexuronate transporter-like MFS transporter
MKSWPGLRWWISSLLFLATVLGYIDRGLIGFLKGDLQRDLHWNEIDYANVVAAFSLAYAFGQLFSGRVMDVIGTRRGFIAAVGLWSIAAMAHAAAASLLGFAAARFALGFAEGGNYPGATKAVSEWFPKKERAIGAGIFNSGSNVGAILTPLIVTLITVRLGFSWRICFIATGLAGMLWLILWLWLYRSPQKHPRLSAAELAYISADPPDSPARIAWPTLLTFRATWAFVIGLSLTSPIWWFYLYWFPDFLAKTFHLDKSHQQGPVIFVYVISDIGSLTGGLISSLLIRRGFTINRGRKLAMLACAICVMPVFFAPRTHTLWTATALIALAAAAHQGWATNLFTLVSDMLPRRAVSSVVGIGGFSAGLVAMLFQNFSGHLLQSRQGSAYTVLFAICSCAYLVALLNIHLLVPRLQPVEIPAT